MWVKNGFLHLLLLKKNLKFFASLKHEMLLCNWKKKKSVYKNKLFSLHLCPQPKETGFTSKGFLFLLHLKWRKQTWTLQGPGICISCDKTLWYHKWYRLWNGSGDDGTDGWLWWQTIHLMNSSCLWLSLAHINKLFSFPPLTLLFITDLTVLAVCSLAQGHNICAPSKDRILYSSLTSFLTISMPGILINYTVCYYWIRGAVK